MGLQVVRRAFAFAAAIDPDHCLQAGEEFRHRVRVVAAAGEGLDADAVGFRLVGAGVVDHALRHQALGRGQRRHRRVAAGVAAGALGDHDRAQHRQQDRDAVAFGAFDPAQDVVLGHVRDFVREHAGDLVFAIGRQHQPGVGADVTAERGEGVDLPVLEHEEGERLRGLVAAGAQPVADALQPALDQRIVEHVAVMAQLAERHRAVLGLLRRAEELACGGADVGQAGVLRRHVERGEGESQCGGERDEAQAGLHW